MILSIVSIFLVLNLNLEWSLATSLISTLLIATAATSVFASFYIVNKSEKIFLENFESWFSNHL
jgi:hypothetical protein